LSADADTADLAEDLQRKARLGAQKTNTQSEVLGNNDILKIVGLTITLELINSPIFFMV
jgi:hypothetical protein